MIVFSIGDCELPDVLRPRGSVIWVAHASRVSALASRQRELS